MSIQKDLKKEGIEVINKLDTIISNDICKSVSRRIFETFPEYDLYDFSKEKNHRKDIVFFGSGMRKASLIFYYVFPFNS